METCYNHTKVCNKMKERNKMNKSIINQLKEKKGYILFMAAYILFLLYKIIYNSTFHEILNPSIIRYIKFATWGIQKNCSY